MAGLRVRVLELFSFLLAKLGECMSCLLEFVTMSPIEWDCPSVFFVPWIYSFLIDLPHDLKCILLSLLLAFSLYLFRYRSYWYCYGYGPFVFYSLFFFCAVACVVLHPITLVTMASYCDGVNSVPSPPTPVELPEEPLTPPEPVVQPQALLLQADEARRSILYRRYLLLNLGGNEDLRRMVSIISSQFAVELATEAALLDDGFRPQSIISRINEIRGLIHSPRGELLSEQTYRSYVTQIREHGTRSSVPYQRVRRAVLNYDLLLERS